MVSARDGSATVELIVACTLAGIATLSVAAGTSVAARMASRAEIRADALNAAQHVLDSLANVARPVDGSLVRGRQTIRWVVTEHEPALHRITLHTFWLFEGRPDSTRFDLLTGPPPRRVPR